MAKQGSKSLWDTEEGGLLDDFWLDVESAKFGYHEKIGDGEASCLILSGKTDNDDVPTLDEDNEEKMAQPLYVSCGSKFEVVKGGKSVEHESGDEDKLFHRSSNLGLWIERVKKIGGDTLALLIDKGDPRVASTWVGLSIHLKREDVEGREKPVLLPTKIKLADEAGSKKGKKAGKVSKSDEDEDEDEPKSKKSKNKGGSGGIDLSDFDKADLKSLRKLAADADDEQEFMDAVMEGEFDADVQAAAVGGLYDALTEDEG